MGTAFLRFAVGLAIVVAIILAFALAVQIGNLAGHGLTEWNVR